MARIRQIKPDFFLDADLTELSPLHRLLFAGLWCHADRAGRLEDKPRELKVKILPFDDGDANAMLADLDRGGFIVRYEVGGQRLIQIAKFEKHQHFHRDEKASTLPGPPHAETVSACAAEALLHAATTVAPVQHGASTVPAPDEHHASTMRAPVQHAGDQVSEIGYRGSGGGNSDAAPPLAPLNSVADSLGDRMQVAFAKAKGASYAWTRRDDDALRQLARLSSGDDDEVMRRWEIALAWVGFPSCASLRDLAERWNAYAQPQARAGPVRDVRRGVARAEDQDHSKARVTADGTIDF